MATALLTLILLACFALIVLQAHIIERQRGIIDVALSQNAALAETCDTLKVHLGSSIDNFAALADTHEQFIRLRRGEPVREFRRELMH